MFELKLNEIIIAVLNLLNLTFYGIIPGRREECIECAIVYRVIELVVHKSATLDWPRTAAAKRKFDELCIPFQLPNVLSIYRSVY